MILCFFVSCAFLKRNRKEKNDMKRTVQYFFFLFSLGKFVILVSVSSLSYFCRGSLNINSWEWGFGNRVCLFFIVKNAFQIIFFFLSRGLRGVLCAHLFYAAYKNTTGDNKIFKVVFNGDGKSKQSWLTFGFL